MRGIHRNNPKGSNVGALKSMLRRYTIVEIILCPCLNVERKTVSENHTCSKLAVDPNTAKERALMMFLHSNASAQF